MPEPRSGQPLFLANHLALDFVNSAFGVGDEYQDFFTDDASVVCWLKSAELLPGDFSDVPPGLARQARAVREAAIQMLDACQTGKPGNPELINQLLDKGQPVRRLEWVAELPGFRVTEYRRDNSIDALLEPVAMAIALLLSGDERKYIRQCEAHDCTLWFLDTTKSHRRRWCSMALCGNRMKVAAFRARRHQTG
jgi:predicted RNA-binding Zn ribbon-like protein